MSHNTTVLLQKKRDFDGNLHLDSERTDALIGYIKFLEDTLDKSQALISRTVDSLGKSEKALKELVSGVHEIN